MQWQGQMRSGAAEMKQKQTRGSPLSESCASASPAESWDSVPRPSAARKQQDRRVLGEQVWARNFRLGESTRAQQRGRGLLRP